MMEVEGVDKCKHINNDEKWNDTENWRTIYSMVIGLQ